LLIEEANEGGQAILIDKLENYPGFAEPTSGYDLATAMKKQALAFGAEFLAAKVTGLGRQGDFFAVALEAPDPESKPTVIHARTVLLATGASHRQLGVAGEAEYYGRGVSYCATCDGPFFKGKHIVVVGGGDAACDEAGFLAHLTNRVTIIHRRDRFRAQRALAERTLHNPNITVRFNTVVEAILGDAGPTGKVTGLRVRNLETGETTTVPCDAVFIFVGMDPRTELAALAKKDEGGYIVTDEGMQTSVPGLFAAGDIRSKTFRQIVTAVADGAIAAHSASTCIDEQRCEARR